MKSIVCIDASLFVFADARQLRKSLSQTQAETVSALTTMTQGLTNQPVTQAAVKEFGDTGGE